MSEENESSTEENGADGAPIAKNKKSKVKTFVCTEETYFRNRLWKPGMTTSDPRAEGPCFEEMK